MLFVVFCNCKENYYILNSNFYFLNWFEHFFTRFNGERKHYQSIFLISVGNIYCHSSGKRYFCYFFYSGKTLLNLLHFIKYEKKNSKFAFSVFHFMLLYYFPLMNEKMRKWENQIWVEALCWDKNFSKNIFFQRSDCQILI